MKFKAGVRVKLPHPVELLISKDLNDKLKNIKSVVSEKFIMQVKYANFSALFLTKPL